MRKTFIVIALAAVFGLGGFGCILPKKPVTPVVVPPPAPSVLSAAYGEPVSLTIGASAEFDDGLTITLTEINDSRCPQDVQCIWEGELAPVLRLRGGDITGETELVLGTVRGLTDSVGPYAVALSDVTLSSVVLVADKSAVVAHDDKIRVTSPLSGAVVTSPLTVSGEARGTWYFEASFPVKLLDADGNELAVVPAQAQGDWMTEDYVPFSAVLTFDTPATETGTLVFQKDNPSGLPELDDALRMPVKFAESAGPQRTVTLYFYDDSRDRDETGNVMCSRAGLVGVERDIPLTKTPIQDAVRLLLEGGLTAEERASGISTEFPLPGVELKAASLNDGVLTLTFDDPNNRTGGGSCRAGILWFQIEATAKQFPEVSSVRFMPEELFQP